MNLRDFLNLTAIQESCAKCPKGSCLKKEAGCFRELS
jgi:hypothetical protein